MNTKIITFATPRLLGFIVLAVCITALILVLLGQSQALFASVGWHGMASVGWHG